MENTLENKAKFFALYWGQKVVNWNNKLQIKLKLNVLINEIDEMDILELKPLSSITDEEAFNYAKNYLGWSAPEDYKKMFLDQGCEIKGHRHADYLRSKGYALSWMGLSVETMIEFGWIKLKNIAS